MFYSIGTVNNIGSNNLLDFASFCDEFNYGLSNKVVEMKLNCFGDGQQVVSLIFSSIAYVLA